MILIVLNSAWKVFAVGCASDIAALDLGGELVDKFLDIGLARINRQHMAEDFQRSFIESLALEDETHS